MAYFLKKTHNKKGTYLQIYESYYDPARKGGAHRSYKPIGYVHELIQKGMADPIAFYGEEVRKLNADRAKEKQQARTRQITDVSPEKFLGYFPIKRINDSLGVQKYLDLMQLNTGLRFNVYEMMSALIYARLIRPCSKSKTYEDVLPQLFEERNYSLDQLYSGIEYIGCEYEKVIEIYNHQLNQRYPVDIAHTYFDCTNFYFEIDREDDFRRKGPSKENRREPIVGLGLLLDAHQIPIGMKVFPGNESEKPVIRSVIDELKRRNQATGRTIQVADKGLNCADNIMHALKAGDGYIFSKSVKMLPATEKEWILLKNDYREVRDAQGELRYRIKECIDDFPYEYMQEDGKKRTIMLREKRIVTYNPKLAEKQIFEINRQVEKARALKASQAKRSEFGDSAKFVSFIPADKQGKKTDGSIRVEINQEAIDCSKALAGYNLIVTSEVSMTAEAIYAAYHNLWRIEESFRVMKTHLDARPVYLQKRDTITGHFLICYLAVLLLRVFQIHILHDEYSTEDIFDFIRDFHVMKLSDRQYINLSRSSALLKTLADSFNLPLLSYYLLSSDIQNCLKPHTANRF